MWSRDGRRTCDRDGGRKWAGLLVGMVEEEEERHTDSLPSALDRKSCKVKTLPRKLRVSHFLPLMPACNDGHFE